MPAPFPLQLLLATFAGWVNRGLGNELINGEPSTGGGEVVYLNDGGGTFRDVTAVRMPADSAMTMAVATGDVDGDGDPDVVCANGGPQDQQNRLYLNDGSGAFTDATAAQMPVGEDRTQAVAFADVDQDGDVDLVCGNFAQQNRLYLNDGTGTFTDATVERMPTDADPRSIRKVGRRESLSKPASMKGRREITVSRLQSAAADRWCSTRCGFRLCRGDSGRQAARA